LHIFRLSAKGLFVKKIHVLNQGIVHMIDDIFCNCGFRTESQGEQVLLIIEIIVLFELIAVIAIIVLIEVVLKGTR
jgi:hypothetical protein